MRRYPLFVMFVFLAFSTVIAWIFPLSFGIGVIASILGSVSLVSGALLILAAAGLFRMRKTTIDPTKSPDNLVTDGLYAFTRNPMYLGMLMILIGFSLLIDAVTALIFPLVFFAFMNWRLIPQEEAVVESAFDAAYRDYKHRTRRWL